MKKLLIIMLALTFLLGMTAVAIAATSNPSTYTDPTPGTSPHGGYLATTSRCKICHGVHNADTAAGFKLLRNEGAGNVAGACSYCHGATAGRATNRPYEDASFNSEHTIGEATLPDGSSDAVLDLGTADALDCIDCHSQAPHGRVSGGNTKLLIASTVQGTCVTCHDQNNVATLSGGSHVLTGAAAPFFRNSITSAWSNTANCVSCHAGTADGPDLFPHRANGYRLLKNAVTTSASLDNVCVDCHTSDGNYDATGDGVGDTF